MTKKREGESHPHTAHSAELEKKLIENMVELQKVQTNLAEKFNKLSEQISSLLGLFEMAARSFAQNPVNQVTERDKQFLEKIDKLLEQNKTLAKGLTLMEERVRERVYGQPGPQQAPSRMEEEFKPSPDGRPLPRF